MAKTTKRKLVEDHLIARKSISSLDAITLYWATRLSAIIYNLKKDGWVFRTVMETHSTGSHYARYYLVSAPSTVTNQQRNP